MSESWRARCVRCGEALDDGRLWADYTDIGLAHVSCRPELERPLAIDLSTYRLQRALGIKPTPKKGR